MDRDKAVGVLDWPSPRSVKELRGFFGLSGYYRRFIRGYGILAKPSLHCYGRESHGIGQCRSRLLFISIKQ